MLLKREETRQLWHHGFDSYMDHAFPMDEVRAYTGCLSQLTVRLSVDAESMPWEGTRLCQSVGRIHLW